MRLQVCNLIPGFEMGIVINGNTHIPLLCHCDNIMIEEVIEK